MAEPGPVKHSPPPPPHLFLYAAASPLPLQPSMKHYEWGREGGLAVWEEPGEAANPSPLLHPRSIVRVKPNEWVGGRLGRLWKF